MINRRYAVLGLLIEEPDYGYRLTWRMLERLGSMPIGRSYVYMLLKQLGQDGLVYRSAEERGDNGLTRAVFAEDLVDALGPHLVSTADRISARLGYRRGDDLPGQT